MSVKIDRLELLDLSDLVIKAGSDRPRVIRCHKLVLAANSKVFKDMFKRAAAATGQTSSAEILNGEMVIRNFRCVTVADFVDFCYRGELGPDARRTSDLLLMADKYQVWTLREHLASYLASNVTRMNVAALLSASEICKIPELTKAVHEFLRKDWWSRKEMPGLDAVFAKFPQCLVGLFDNYSHVIKLEKEFNDFKAKMEEERKSWMNRKTLMAKGKATLVKETVYLKAKVDQLTLENVTLQGQLLTAKVQVRRLENTESIPAKVDIQAKVDKVVQERVISQSQVAEVAERKDTIPMNADFRAKEGGVWALRDNLASYLASNVTRMNVVALLSASEICKILELTKAVTGFLRKDWWSLKEIPGLDKIFAKFPQCLVGLFDNYSHVPKLEGEFKAQVEAERKDWMVTKELMAKEKAALAKENDELKAKVEKLALAKVTKPNGVRAGNKQSKKMEKSECSSGKADLKAKVGKVDEDKVTPQTQHRDVTNRMIASQNGEQTEKADTEHIAASADLEEVLQAILSMKKTLCEGTQAVQSP